MTETLHIEIVRRAELSPHRYQEVLALCERAYHEDLSHLMATFDDPTHVLGYLDGELVSHALWIARTLTYQGMPLRCAYVEAVATEPRYQGRGYASHVLRTLAAAIASFDVGALSPSDPAYYTRLGWEQWQGPLAVATGEGVTPTPDEEVMILRLPNTPPLDLHEGLIAPWRVGEIW